MTKLVKIYLAFNMMIMKSLSSATMKALIYRSTFKNAKTNNLWNLHHRMYLAMKKGNLTNLVKVNSSS